MNLAPKAGFGFSPSTNRLDRRAVDSRLCLRYEYVGSCECHSRQTGSEVAESIRSVGKIVLGVSSGLHGAEKEMWWNEEVQAAIRRKQARDKEVSVDLLPMPSKNHWRKADGGSQILFPTRQTTFTLRMYADIRNAWQVYQGRRPDSFARLENLSYEILGDAMRLTHCILFIDLKRVYDYDRIPWDKVWLLPPLEWSARVPRGCRNGRYPICCRTVPLNSTAVPPSRYAAGP